MSRSTQRRYDQSWKLSASMLGLVALVLAAISVSTFDLGLPWSIAVYVAVILLTLVVGTALLVPRRSSSRPPSDR